MATIKKNSKAQIKLNICNDLETTQLALKSGATLVENNFWNKIEYGVQYPTGGYFRISKNIYNKLTK
jgi:hypothetical protein